MNPNHPDGLPDAPGWPIHPAMLSTTDHIAGFEICQTLALVQNFQRTPLTGWTTSEISAQIENARMQAIEAMLHDAVRYGANAIIGIRYAISDGQPFLNILVSGTCVLARRCDNVS